VRWFDDVWTKEVFAEFIAAKLVNLSFPLDSAIGGHAVQGCAEPSSLTQQPLAGHRQSCKSRHCGQSEVINVCR